MLNDTTGMQPGQSGVRNVLRNKTWLSQQINGIGEKVG